MNYTYQQVKPVLDRCIAAINDDQKAHDEKINRIKHLATRCYVIEIENKYKLEIFATGAFLCRDGKLISELPHLTITHVTKYLKQAEKCF